MQANNRAGEALDVLRQALALHPGEPRLATAFGEIEADYFRQQRREALAAMLAKIPQLLEQDPVKARQMLEEAAQDNPEDSRVAAALEEARQACAAREREASIDALCRETRLFLQSREFAPALDTIQKGLEAFTGERRLEQMRETVLASKADWERAEGIRQAVEDAGRFASQGQLETAIESLMTATRIFGPEDRLDAALATTRKAIDQKQRQERIEQASREVDGGTEAQRLDSAEQMIDRAAQAEGAAPEFEALRRRLAAARAEREQAEAVRRALAESEALIAAGDPERASAVLESLLVRYPGNQQLLNARLQVAQALRAKQAEAAIEAACQEIRALLGRNEFKTAVKKIDRAQSTLGPDRRFDQLRTEAASAKAAAANRRREPQPASGVSRRKSLLLYAAVLIGVTVLGAALVVKNLASGRTVRLQVRVSPENASVSVAGQTCNRDCSFDLKPGDYQVQVSASGFQPVTQAAKLSRENSQPVLTIALKPLKPTVQVTANYSQSQVFLDGAPKGALQDGQFALDSLEPGKHGLKVIREGGGRGGLVSNRVRSAAGRR